jgi:hypothetical protein
MTPHQAFLDLKPIILRWEGDDELWILRPLTLIGTVADGHMNGGLVYHEIPVLVVDHETEQEINQYHGHPADEEDTPTHDELFAMLVEAPHLLHRHLAFAESRSMNLVAYINHPTGA